MNQKSLTLEQRVQNLEKALLSFIFFVTSYLSLSNPGTITKLFGTIAVIMYLGMFLLSTTLTIYYSSIIGISIASDATNKIIVIIVQNKKIVALILIGFLISIAIASLYYLGYTSGQIIGGVILALLGSIIISHKKIYDYICEIISKIENLENKKNIK